NATLTLDDTTLTQWMLAGGTINGGTVSTTGSAALIASNGGGTPNGITLKGTLDGSLSFRVTANVTNGMTMDRGTILIAGDSHHGGNVLHFSGPHTLAGTGSIQFAPSQDNFPLVDSDSSLTIGPNVTIHGITGTVGDAGGTITNNGTITSDGAGTITVQN